MMGENIELHSFRTNETNRDSDNEEYHEINQEIPKTTFSPKHSTKTLKDFDFFTQHDVKIVEKGSTKKKKPKMKERTSNLMDLISSELASVVLPIRENVIMRVDYTREQQNSYLESTPRALKIFQRKSTHYDSENGWGKQDLTTLCPIFPKVLDSAVTVDNTIPVQYVEPSMFNDLITENLNIDTKQSTKFLDIEIKDMKFKYHHQFSLERLLYNKLMECYNEYISLQNSLTDITKDIKIIRETRDNLKQELTKVSPNKKEDIRFDPSVRKYTGQLIQLKDKNLETLMKQKELKHNIISLWSDIEMVREKTGKQETNYSIIITKTVQDEDEYEKEWNDIFNIEFSDMLDKMENDYVDKYIEYREVKYTQNLDDSAKRRMSKPKLVIDEDSIKEEVEILVNNIFPRDKIDLILNHNENITTEVDNPRKNFIKHNYYFEIFVDDVFVCESDHFTGQSNTLSEIEFVESFSVQILPKNTTLVLTLCENQSKVANLNLNLSDIKTSIANAEFVTQNLNYNDIIIEPNSKHIGSGYNIKQIATQNKVRLKSSNIFKGNLYTTCEAKFKMGWNEKLSQHQNEAIKSSMDIGRQLKRLLHGIDKPNTDLLREIIAKIYDKEVNDEKMINTLRSLCQTEVPIDDTFPIDENSPEYVRLKLLHLRNIGGLNIDNKMIPLHASQISTEQLNCLQSNESEIEVQYYNDKYSEMDPIELQRHIGMKYVQKLNKNMLRNLNEYLLRKTHKDVVRDFKDLSLRSLFSNQSNLATLTTISSSTKQQLLQEALSKEQEIRVNVVRAFNLMDRSAALLDEEGSDELIAGYKMRPLRPFVRASYRGAGAGARTAAAIGCHPSWNQTLMITNKPDPLSSIHINIYDEHKSNVSDRSGSDEESHRTVQYRYYNKWLGTLAVPLHTVLTLGSLRGTFKLTTPPMLFGYETIKNKDSTRSLIPEVTQLLKKDTSFITLHITTTLSHLGGLQGYNQPIPNSDEDYLIKHLNNFVTEYLNDFPSRNISLTLIDSAGINKCVTQFLQPIPLPDIETFPKMTKNRSESALSKSSGLSKSSSTSSRRKEEEKTSFQSGEERESLYSAYDVGSWRNDNQVGGLMDSCLRYVSLIPTYEVVESHVVTLMGVELLKVLHGSPLDHTLLLASYYLHLGVRCYIATGLSLPRGLTTYILIPHHLSTRRAVLLNEQLASRRFGNRSGYVWYVYDAVTGERSLLRDVGCPLKTVQFVFDADNIWVNVQSSQDCESVSFDFTRSSDWQPVFDKTIFVMKQSVSTDALYSAPRDASSLRQVLETKIKHKLQRWRPHTNTVWNRYCSSLLREMLSYWEYWTFHPSEPKPALSQRLKQLMVTYKMFGFPLNMPYVNTKSVISTVKSTGVHACDDPSAEFALAVEVYAYPNNVVSVWVFLASIIRV